MGKSDAIFSSFELQTIEEVENEKDTAGKDVGSGLVQKLRKWCLLTELCFLCDNWPPLLHEVSRCLATEVCKTNKMLSTKQITGIKM